MPDSELRDLERAYDAAPDDKAALETLIRARNRAGLCGSCGKNPVQSGRSCNACLHELAMLCFDLVESVRKRHGLSGSCGL